MLTKLFDTEPTLVVTFVRAVLICAVAFGLHLSPEQIGVVLLCALVGVGPVTVSTTRRRRVGVVQGERPSVGW